MRLLQHRITIGTAPREIREVTKEVAGWVAAQEVERLYRHQDEGPDDMPAHLESALTQVQLTIPVTDSRIPLGTWQGIFLLEHRASAHCRDLVLTLLGE